MWTPGSPPCSSPARIAASRRWPTCAVDVSLGSADSAQAAIRRSITFIRPVSSAAGLPLLRYDLDVGKHGDTGTSELEVLRALQEGRAEAGGPGRVDVAARCPKGESMQCRSGRSGRPPATATAISRSWQTLPRTWGSVGPRRCSTCTLRTRVAAADGLGGTQRAWIRADPAILEGYQVLLEAVEQQGLASDWQV